MREAIKRLELRARARMPAAVRLVYRMARALQRVELSRPLTPELVADCRFCATRFDLLERLPQGGVAAELGTLRGDFARKILARNKPRELHLIDLDYSKFDETLLADKRIVRHQGDTVATIACFPDASFDWIYVDAGHSYDAVRADAHACAPKLKPGGFLVFNDFAHIDPFLGRYGVHRAVVDFALETRWPFRFFAFDIAALYDVALQKPDAGVA